MWPDEALYAWYAKQIFAHPLFLFSGDISQFHPPLFPLLLSIGHFFFQPEQACRVVVFLINILGITGIYLLGTRIQGRFLGCFAAMMLSFNPLYFTMASFILIDGALAVFMILFFYVLAGVSDGKIARQDFYLGCAAMALILLKWSAGLILPFLFLYYLLAFSRLTFRERLIKAAVPLIFGAFTVGILLWHNYAVSGNYLPKVFEVSDGSYRQPFFYYFNKFIGNSVYAPFVPFFILGLWLTFRSDNRNCWVQGFWVVFALLSISAMPNKDFRFMLPIIPSIALVTGMGADAFLSRVEKKAALLFLKPLCLILIFGFFVFCKYPKIEKYMVDQSFNYVGFQAAGTYVKEKVALSPDTLILASSPRAIRYYTDIDFKKAGGKLSHIPEHEAEFTDMIENSSSDVILVIDIWEWAQPQWIYPVEDRHFKFLEGLGFQLERVINRDILDEADKLQNKSVVLVFHRPGKGH
jgi:4-amino-4-deoxy-L-arabinose transferase-like glycosyltransferase